MISVVYTDERLSPVTYHRQRILFNWMRCVHASHRYGEVRRSFWTTTNANLPSLPLFIDSCFLGVRVSNCRSRHFAARSPTKTCVYNAYVLNVTCHTHLYFAPMESGRPAGNTCLRADAKDRLWHFKLFHEIHAHSLTVARQTARQR